MYIKSGRLFLRVRVLDDFIPLIFSHETNFDYDRLGEHSAIMLVNKLRGSVDILREKVVDGRLRPEVVNRLYTKE